MKQKCYLIMIAVLLLIGSVGCQQKSEDKNEDTSVVNKDDDASNFVDWKVVLKDSIGVDVVTMLDEYDQTSGTIKVGDNIGIMLSGINKENQKWVIEIKDDSVVKFVGEGPEKGVEGERQGFDFFAFEGLKAGTTEITIKDTDKASDKVYSEYVFTITVE